MKLPSGHVAEVSDQIPRRLAKSVRRSLLSIQAKPDTTPVDAMDAMDDAIESVLAVAVTSLKGPDGTDIPVTAESLGGIGDGDFEELEKAILPIFERLVPGMFAKFREQEEEPDPKSGGSSTTSDEES